MVYGLGVYNIVVCNCVGYVTFYNFHAESIKCNYIEYLVIVFVL